MNKLLSIILLTSACGGIDPTGFYDVEGPILEDNCYGLDQSDPDRLINMGVWMVAIIDEGLTVTLLDTLNFTMVQTEEDKPFFREEWKERSGGECEFMQENEARLNFDEEGFTGKIWLRIKNSNCSEGSWANCSRKYKITGVKQ